MDYNAWVSKASEKIEKLPSEYIFVLKDLFQGTEWNELTRTEKQALGRYFKNAVNDGVVSGVVHLENVKNGSKKYQKK